MFDSVGYTKILN